MVLIDKTQFYSNTSSSQHLNHASEVVPFYYATKQRTAREC